MAKRDGNGVVLSTLDKMLPSRSTRLWVQSIAKERDEQKEKADRAQETLQQAARSLMRAAPGIVLSSLGFAFASEADGDGRVALMALLLFVAGTAAYVFAIGLASDRLKPDSVPGKHDRSA